MYSLDSLVIQIAVVTFESIKISSVLIFAGMIPKMFVAVPAQISRFSGIDFHLLQNTDHTKCFIFIFNRHFIVQSTKLRN
mmetsp:Transcript_20899/g.41447  ORF Transcript_20899/g.41447 Transcript_20899/m.41447 type:complete len:80 (-) Transcript_20899:619-858(-)